MTSTRTTLVVSACLLFACLGCHASTVLLVDSTTDSYLQSSPVTDVSKQLYSVLAPSLMGLQPAAGIDDELSQQVHVISYRLARVALNCVCPALQISQIVNPSPFRHPQAFVVLHLLGAADGMLHACLV
jgi:hypothetical protein